MWEKIKSKLFSKAGKIALLVLGCYILIILAGVVVVDGRYVRFYMSGSQDMTVEHGTEFKDPGVYAVTNGKIFGEGEKKLKMETSGQVDTKKLGKYELSYQCKYWFRDYETKRTVTVVDTTAPVIELQYTEGYVPKWFTGYEEEGFKATDSCDGDISDKVSREVLEDRIVYSVKDSSGNEAVMERFISLESTKPQIILKGGEKQEISARMDYADPGFTATDSEGNDYTQLVTVEGEVQPFTPGEYKLIYSITNEQGQKMSVERQVIVHQAMNPTVVEPGQKTIYLTFDDGPGPYTGALLNVLSRYNVPATFFVTGLNSKYEDQIGRAFREGHAIGVHSLTHNYYEIYASEEAFFEDFNAVQDMIYRQTGQYTDLTRFPGGSSNTVSSFNQGIMSRLAYSLESMGYKYFDWNVTSGDAGETKDKDQVVENVINGIAGRKYAVVLQHDIKDYSVNAVEEIILWGLANGYVFSALNSTSPDAHHGIAN